MPDYSQFKPTPLAVRMEQGHTKDGKLRLEVEFLMPEGNELLMIGLREAVQQLIRKVAGGKEPVFEEEYDRKDNPKGYDESLESYYNRTAGGWDGDPKRSN